MFFEIVTTIVSRAKLTDTGLEVDSHNIDIASDDEIPQTVALAIVHGGLQAALRKVEQADPQVKAAARRTKDS